MEHYPRDLHGYGANPRRANWPGGAYVAVQFVLNYEEGGENNILHGDQASEAFLVDVLGAAPWPGQRHVESMYEYGARAGFWRLHRLFTEKNLPFTVYGSRYCPDARWGVCRLRWSYIPVRQLTPRVTP